MGGAASVVVEIDGALSTSGQRQTTEIGPRMAVLDGMPEVSERRMEDQRLAAEYAHDFRRLDVDDRRLEEFMLRHRRRSIKHDRVAGFDYKGVVVQPVDGARLSDTGSDREQLRSTGLLDHQLALGAFDRRQLAEIRHRRGGPRLKAERGENKDGTRSRCRGAVHVLPPNSPRS